MWKEQFEVETFKLNHPEPADFSISIWQKKKKVTWDWVMSRCLSFVYYLATFIVVLYFWLTDKHKTKREKQVFLIFISNWSHILQVVVFLFGFIVSAVDYSREQKDEESEGEVTVLKKVFWFLYTMALPCSILICIGFWACLHRKDEKITFSTVILHVINGVIHFIDFFFIGLPHRLYHFYMPWIFALVYFIFSAIYEVLGGTGISGQIPIYPFLDWKYHPGKTACYAVAFLIILTVIHVIFFLFYMMKLTLKRKVHGE